MTTRFSAGWWSVELPPGWHGEIGKRGVGFERTPALGWIQVTCAHKPGPATDADLEAIAALRTSGGVPLHALACGMFTGFTADHVEDGTFWREWWLRYGNMIVYASYNVAEESKDAETAEVDRLVGSLVPGKERKLSEVTTPPSGSEPPRSRRLPHRGSGRHFPK